MTTQQVTLTALPGPGIAARLASTVRRWQRRMRERQELARLDHRDLRDIGASPSDVWNETNQWFWRCSRPF